MTRNKALLYLLLIFSLASLGYFLFSKREVKEKTGFPQEPTQTRKVPITLSRLEEQRLRESLKFFPIEGATDYMFVRGTTDYAKIKALSQKDKINYILLEEVPEKEPILIRDSSTSNWQKVINNFEPRFSIEVPMSWETDKPEGLCEESEACESEYLTIFRDGPSRKAKFEVTVAHYKWDYYDPDPDAILKRHLKHEERATSQPKSKWYREEVPLGSLFGELVIFKPDRWDQIGHSLGPEGPYDFNFNEAIYLDPKKQTLIFRVIPELDEPNLVAYVALHGNNPSKEDWELARKVALSFRYLKK